MRFKSLVRFPALVCALLTGGAGAEAAAPPDWVATRTRAHLPAFDVATDVGALSEAETVSIAVSLQLRDRATLTALTDKLLANGGSPALTSQQFLDRHAPTPSQVDRVVAHLRANGFQNIAVCPALRNIDPENEKFGRK